MAAPFLVQNLDFLHDPARLDTVREADRQVDEGIAQYDSIRIEAKRRVTFIVAWECATLRRLGGFRLLGFRSESAYWETKLKRVISRTNWFKVVGIAERLSHLSREQFFALPSLEAAEVLSRQDPAVRSDPEMLERVQGTSARKLKQELTTGDDTCVWKLKLTHADRDTIQLGVETWAKDHGIEEPAQAVRLIVSDVTNRLTLTGFLAEAVRRLTPLVARSQNFEELRSLFLTHLSEISEALELSKQIEQSAGASAPRQFQGSESSFLGQEPADPRPSVAE